MIHKSKLLAVSLLGFFVVCFAARAQSPSATPRTPDEASIGSIEGRVVNENGQALAGAGVFVRSANASTVLGRNTTSDLEGNFRVTGLERGLYLVSANSPAYTSAPSDPDNPTYYRLGDSVSVTLVRGGAITGIVTNASGEPVIAVRVRAIMIRDGRGQAPQTPQFAFQEQQTDDRGIYRIYGVTPGTYLVSAGGAGFAPSFNPFDTDVPTFAPSATRDNAAEITVRSGEDTNVDIRYRGEPGRAISGAVKSSGTSSATVMLTQAGSNIPVANTFQIPGARGFAFTGLTDGDYELVAQEIVTGPSALASGTFSFLVSEPKKVTVKGADVTGIELVPRPQASIAGRIALESSKAPECKGKRPPLLAETIIQLRRPDKEQDKDSSVLRTLGATATPDTSGAFVMRNVKVGRYQFQPHYYARYWYVQSISTSSGTPKPVKIDAAANWTTVKAGDQLSNLTITLAEGAASIRGRVAVAEGATVPNGMPVYLVPSEPDKAEDVLRFFVSDVAADGTFAFNNLPPGKYFALLQLNTDAQIATSIKLRQPEAASARAKLRRAAETKKIEIELKPCQNVNDYQLKQ